LAQLGVERAIVISHSLGSLVALELALQHPELVDGLVLVAGYFYPTARADAFLMSIGDSRTRQYHPLHDFAASHTVLSAWRGAVVVLASACHGEIRARLPQLFRCPSRADRRGSGGQCEDVAKAAYEEALQADLPMELKSAIRRQYTGVKENHDLIKRLRDAA
jgi:pimeloyl-ACP methyl ester carboxylesterase